MRTVGWSLFCLATVFVLAASTFASGINDQPEGPVPGRFIVKLAEGRIPAAIAAAQDDHGKFRKAFRMIPDQKLVDGNKWDRYYVFQSDDPGTTADEVLKKFGRDNVEYIEPDYYVQFLEFPQDSLFSNQWYLYNTGQEYLGIERVIGDANDLLVYKTGTPDVDVRLVEYYTNTPTDKTEVVVAIVDTGVDSKHPELQGKFWQNPDEIPDNGIDDDHNGYVDDVIGFDITGDYETPLEPIGDNDPNDLIGHGTHIAGIVAASADTRGIAGIAPNARIMAISINPNTTTSAATEGILYAVNSGARIINASWGTIFESSMLREALEFARLNNVFVSIAAGNSGDNTRDYPAAYDSSFVVTAGDSDGFLTPFATWGAHIDIVAPGLDILSLRADGTDMYSSVEPGVRIIGDDSLYYLSDGSSMSAPMACGAAALVLAKSPGLTVAELENILLESATDMLDPFNTGDNLVGPDTFSGHGYLNIDAALASLVPGTIAITQPERWQRYTTALEIKGAAVNSYSGPWYLEYSVGFDEYDWQPLADGSTLPADSVLYVFDNPAVEGPVYLRLTDFWGNQYVTGFYNVRANTVRLDHPTSGEDVQYNVEVRGSMFGPTYDSLRLYYVNGSSPVLLLSSTAEYFDSLIYNWALSGTDTGQFTLYLQGFFDGEEITESADIHVSSAFAEGWPRTLGDVPARSPVSADLDHDGSCEIILGTASGLYVFHPDGSIVDGFPVRCDADMRSIPAVYDVDRDGYDEIICTGDSGIHVFNGDGTYAEGWPRDCFTGGIPYGYGYPNPIVAKLGLAEDSAIVIINTLGEILAYEFNGDSYFYAMDGFFATFNPRISDSYSKGGSTSPLVTTADLNADGLQEVVGSYSASAPYCGVGIFDGRTGQPAFDLEDPVVTRVRMVYGTELADLDGDYIPEVITAGYDADVIPHIWIKTRVFDDFPGFPIALPEMQGWVGLYPILGDLDLDGIPEILISFHEYDISRLYIFRADGTAYAQMSGMPFGVAFADFNVFGEPIVANVTGDEYPEIIFRSGYLLPSTGRERLYILDHNADPVPGWPVTTPALPSQVFSTRFIPLVDDIDADGLVDILLVSDNNDLLVWNFDAPSEDGANRGRFLVDNLNSNYYRSLDIPTSTDDLRTLLPNRVSLAQNYPNPFNPATSIRFQLPARSRVALEVFNILGQRVSILLDEELPAGTHIVDFDGATHASGVYLYRLKTDSATLTKKMVMLK
ncbi:MAG: S8 family peptidase [Candidatus Zixiibacteriota bacterium]